MKFAKLVLAAVVALSVSLSAKDDLALKAELKKAWGAQVKEAYKVTKGITTQDLFKMLDEDEEFVLVDVRTPAEVAAGIILTMGKFKAIPRGMVAPSVGKAAALNPAQKIVIYCKAGARSALVAKELQDYYGFKNVVYVKGGINQWIKDGYEIHNKMGEFSVAK